MTILATSAGVNGMLRRAAPAAPAPAIAAVTWHGKVLNVMVSVSQRSPKPAGMSERSRVARKDVERAELAFEDDLGALEAARREVRRRHAALGGAAHVDALDHAALAGFHECQQARAERAADAHRHRRLRGGKLHDLARRDRRAEHAGDARRVKAEFFARALGRQREAEHAFQAGDEGGDQILAADTPASSAAAKRAGQHGGARMHAGRRLAQIVELEGVRESAVGERRARRAGAAKAWAEDRAGGRCRCAARNRRRFCSTAASSRTARRRRYR